MCGREEETGEQHAGPHSGKVQKGLRAKCGGRWFPTSGTLVAIAKTCTGHAQTQWGRSVAIDMQNPQAAGAGDQGRFNAILAQNKAGTREPPGQTGRGR